MDESPKRKTRRGARRAAKQTEFDCCGRPIQFTAEQRTRKARRNCPAWVAPDDMPDHVVLDVFNGVVCGALIPDGKGDDKYCRTPPADADRTKASPYRCRKHGGVPSSQARPGHSISLKYGLYTDCMFEDEKEIWSKLNADSVDEEILMAKVRLRRALRAEKDAKFDLESIEEETGTLGDHEGTEVVLRVKKKYTNRTRLVDQIMNQLARLYALKSQRTSAIIEATSEGVKVYLPDNGRD